MKNSIATIFTIVVVLCTGSLANSANYAESPYDCGISSHVGVDVEVTFLGIKAKGDVNGYATFTWTNAGYSCSIEGVGCTQGFSCHSFLTSIGAITNPNPY